MAPKALEGSEVRQLVAQLLALLDGGQAHATFTQAVDKFPKGLRGIVPDGLPYSAWQLLEHIRIAQRDILDFSVNHDGTYKSLKWPEEYWPMAPEPDSSAAWTHSVKQVQADLEEFKKLLQDSKTNLFEPFPWGDGQNLLREALLIADHTAYHVGELLVVRRLLNAWPIDK